MQEDDEIIQRLRDIHKKLLNKIEKELANCLIPSRLIEIGFEPSQTQSHESIHLHSCMRCRRFQQRLKKVWHPRIELLILLKNKYLKLEDERERYAGMCIFLDLFHGVGNAGDTFKKFKFSPAKLLFSRGFSFSTKYDLISIQLPHLRIFE